MSLAWPSNKKEKPPNDILAWGTTGMGLLLEIIWSTFTAIFDLGRETALRDKSRPRRFLVFCYYVLPVMCVASVFISWKITIIVACAFVASLVAGAMTEADDIGPW